MTLRLQDGKRLAVAITIDFDAHTNWMAAGLTSLAYVSRGEFGAEVGLPRVLSLLRAFDVRATFFVTGQVMVTFPDQAKRIVDGGHEIATHGCFHEDLTTLSPEREKELLERQLEQHEQTVGLRPRGYRAPGWELSEASLPLLEEYGFLWDSSLMGRDFEPYHPRAYELHREVASIVGPPSRLLEFPVSWYLDDFQYFEFAPALGMHGGVAPATVLEMWLDNFNFAIEYVPNGVIVLTVHPQTIGRAHNLAILQRFLRQAADNDGACFASLTDLYDVWHEEDDDARLASSP